jgi:UDP-GlcNAc:undecaprenyl-phosphate GlcNAc-1-phosphate transferase
MTGALLGFLYFNFNPASIFLGDSGSLWTGFMLGCFALIWSHNMQSLPALLAPAIVLSIPLTDTMLSITRRFVAAKPIFVADHGHIHHRLLDRAMPPRSVTLYLCAAGVIASCFALALSLSSELTGVAIALAFFLATILAVRRLVYEEFRILAELLRDVRTSVRYRLLLNTYEQQLTEASSPEACWCALRKMCRDFGFSAVSLRLGGYAFSDQFILSRNEVWVMRIPLSAVEELTLTHRLAFRSATDTLARMADMLHRILCEKAEKFRLDEEGEEPPFIPKVSGFYRRR